jgi:WD40 repeat protein
MDELRLERALSQGPPFATRYVPSPLALNDKSIARRPASVGRLVLIIAVTALLLVGMLAGLAALGAFQNDDRGAPNGWVAFPVWDGDAAQGPVDRDIYIVRQDQAPHRIIGTDSDNLDQICPAFSPDGRRLAYGQAEGEPADFEVGPSGEPITHDPTYRRAALVVVELDAAGNAYDSQTIEVGGSFPPPCATWSADGRRLAFGVSMTSWNNPQRSDAGSEVWIATVDGAEIEVVSDLFATDLEWSPDGSTLAIASHRAGQSLGNGAVDLYSVASGDLRTLVGPSGVSRLSWSPDGRRIAYQRGSPGSGQEIRVAEVDGSAEYLLASGFRTDHGIGPAWSPTGEWIVYQPICDRSPTLPNAPCREESDVVLIPANGEFEGRTPGDGELVIPPLALPGDGASVLRSPFRVTWSPDGKELLYLTFGGPTLIAVPIDSSSLPAVLYDSDDQRSISVYDGDGLLPTQAWGSRSQGQP